MTSTYEIEILPFFGYTPDQEQELVSQARSLVADLTQGIDQTRYGRYDGEHGTIEHRSIFVEHGNVGEVVRRLNEYGIQTDEDEVETPDLVAGVDYPYDGMEEV